MHVSLPEVTDLQLISSSDSDQWLIDNKTKVIDTLGHFHNLEMGNAILHSILTSDKLSFEDRIKKAIDFLERK